MKRTRGLTLIEIMVALVILAILLALALTSAGRFRRAPQPQALAQLVAEELRLARRTAIAGQVPVAVCFPTDGGTVPHSQSLYVQQGETQPRVIRVADFSGDFPGAFVFLGTWGAGATSTQPVHHTSGEPLDPVAWSQGTTDYAFVFTPSGSVQSNGAPLFDGDYHLLVLSGVEFAGAATPPGTFATPLSYFSPSLVSTPYTVTLTPLGEVSVAGGVVGNDGSVQELEHGLATPPPAAALTLAAAGSNDPRISLVDLAPAPPAPGENVVLTQGDHLTMRVEAVDPDGDALFCVWSCDEGSFCSPEEDRMEWNEGVGAWVSTWEWRPPETAAPGSPFTLTCTVSDRRGGAVSRTDTALRQVALGVPQIVVFDSVSPDWTLDVCVANLEGGGTRRLTHTPGASEWRPSFSPDGTRVAFERSDTGESDLYLMSREGYGATNLTRTPNLQEFGPCSWSPDGSRLLHIALATGWRAEEIYVINADGTGQRRLTNNTRSDYLPQWCPVPSSDGGHVIVFTSDRGSAGSASSTILGRFAPDGSFSETGSRGGPWDWANAGFSPDGRTMVLTREVPLANQYELYSTAVDPDAGQFVGAPQTVFNPAWTGSNEEAASFSPDGRRLAFVSWVRGAAAEVYVVDVDATGRAVGSAVNVSQHPTASDGAITMGWPGWWSNISLVWAVDSSRVIFASNRDGGCPNLYSVRPDGTGLARLSSPSTACGPGNWGFGSWGATQP